MSEDSVPDWLRQLDLFGPEAFDDLISEIYDDGIPLEATEETARLVNKHKSYLIKQLLMFAKDHLGDDEFIDGALLIAIDAINALGAKWPELDVIRRSALVDKYRG
jgi:hypothetical protein